MRYFVEFGGGLGDIFHQMHALGAYNSLRDLKSGDRCSVFLVTHNPHARELFVHHPKAEQIDLHDVGYLTGSEYSAARRWVVAETDALLPASPGPVQYFPTDGDWEEMGEIPKRPYLVFSVSAGLPDRTWPAPIIEDVASLAAFSDFALVTIGRSYGRHGREEVEVPYAIDLRDRLSVGGAAEVVRRAHGVLACHSAINLLAWHLKKPQLLLYPESVARTHIAAKDQWAFGINQTGTVHAQFEHFRPELVGVFLTKAEIYDRSTPLP